MRSDTVLDRDDFRDEELIWAARLVRQSMLAALPEPEDCPTDFSPAFEQKMDGLLNRAKRRQTRHKIGRRVAMITLAFLMASGALMTVEAYREKVIEVIVQVFSDLTHFSFSSNYVEEDTALPDVTFGYVPEGMVEDSREEYDGLRYILYGNNSGQLFELSQKIILPGENLQMILDTEDADTEYCYINGEEAIANSKNGNNTVIWSQGNVRYTLYSNLPIEELKKIAENLVISNITFGYIPERFEKSETDFYDDFHFILYKDDSGHLFEITIKNLLPGDDYQMILDTEDADTEYFYINGEEAIANSKDGNNTVIWSQGNALCRLYGNLPVEELKKIALEVRYTQN